MSTSGTSNTTNVSTNSLPPIPQAAQGAPRPQQALDLSKIFYKSQLVHPLDHTSEYYFIPASLLPSEIKQPFLKKITPEEIAEGQLPHEERIKKWRSAYSGKVYLVTSLTPLKISGMKATDFYKKYNKSLVDLLKANLSLSTVTVTHPSEAKNSLKIQSQTDKRTVAYRVDSDSLIEHSRQMDLFFFGHRVHQQMEIFSRDVCQIINTSSLKSSPKETSRTLFDSILQSIIASSHLSSGEKTALAKDVMSSWGTFLFELGNVVGEIHELSAARSFLLNAEKVLTGIKEMIHTQYASDVAAQKITAIYNSFLGILKYGLSLKEDGLFVYFVKELYKNFVSNTLDAFGQIHLTMDRSRHYLIEMLKAKATNLHLCCQIYDLRALESEESAATSFAILAAIEKQNWLSAFNAIDNYTKILVKACEYKNFKYTQGHDGTIIKIPIITIADFEKLRILHFIRALKDDLNYVLSEGLLFRPVSEVALELIKTTFGQIQIPLSSGKNILPEFNNWLLALKEQGYEELLALIKEMQPHWTTLKGIYENLRISDKFNGDVQTLLTLVNDEHYEEFSTQYQKIVSYLITEIEKWEASLRLLNEKIHQVQELSIIMLSNPKLPKLEPSHLQSQFGEFNKRLAELVQPMTVFFSAFQQLICIGKTPETFKATSDSQISLRFGSDGSPFSLSLFETSDQYFKQLAINLQQFKPDESILVEVEIDEPIPEKQVPSSSPLSSNPEITATESLEDRLKEIFIQTKRRVIVKDLKSLMKDYGVSFFTRFGKGDHNKLYINNIPIVLPEHREWKPGTAKSIQNDVLNNLQQLLTSTTGGSSSSSSSSSSRNSPPRNSPPRIHSTTANSSTSSSSSSSSSSNY